MWNLLQIISALLFIPPLPVILDCIIRIIL